MHYVRDVRSIVFLTVAAIVAACAVIRALPAEHEAAADTSHPQEIRGVSLDALDNGHGLPVSALRAVLDTKSGSTLDPARLEHDRTALRQLLESRGYLASRVDAPSVTFANGGAYVVFSIVVGQKFHFRDIKLVGVNARDTGLVTIGAWDLANLERVERVRGALAGGAHKTVVASVTTDATAAAVDVEFTAR